MEVPFAFAMPLTKSLGHGADGAERRVVEGIVSTEALDQQDERVIQKGVDFAPLMERGYIDWNHMGGRNPGAILGVPQEARIETYKGGPGLYVKALLYNTPGSQADETWRLINAIEKANGAGYPERQIGWSVQGAILAVQGKDLVRSVVRHAALTHEPVNTDTWATVAKSMAGDNRRALSKMLAATTPGLAAAGPFGAGGGALSALGLQNLAGSGPVPLEAVQRSLLGACARGHLDDRGQPIGGRQALLKHLVECRGAEPARAKQFLLGLYRAIGAAA